MIFKNIFLKKRQTYLQEVRVQSKMLYVILLVVMAMHLILNIANNQITPVYVWSMYGAREPQRNTFETYVLKYNNDTFNLPLWRDHQKMFFTYTIPRYDEYIHNHYEDPFEVKSRKHLLPLHLSDTFFHRIYNTNNEIKEYPLWLKNYLQGNLGIKIDSIAVDKYWLHYDKTGHVITDSITSIIRE